MSARAFRWLRFGALACLGLTLGIVTLGWLPADAGRRGTETVLVLVVRDMAFFRDGEFDTPNPALQFDAGARVRLVLRNEDPGMTHNFTVPAWSVATRDLESNEVAQVEFVVPEETGRPTYECTPHARRMRGTIEIK